MGFRIEAQISQIERSKRQKNNQDKETAAALQRHLAKKRADEVAEIMKKREATRKRKDNLAKVKRLRAKEAERKKAKKEAAAKVKAKLDALPKTWSGKDCGQKGKPGIQARKGCLDRLQLRAPGLTEEKSLRWPKLRDEYAKHYPKKFPGKHPNAIGAEFIKDINKVLESLCCFYSGPTKFNKGKKDAGDANAFDKFFQAMDKSIPKPGCAVTM